MPQPSSHDPVVYRQKRVVGLGEVLWDRAGNQSHMGGAPANFAVMAARLGDHGILASRVGIDDAGRRARNVLAELPLDLNFLQTDREHPTGEARVVFDSANEPHYDFLSPCAWDCLDLTPQWRELALSADAVCFGTLAQRDPRSRRTIHAFLAATRPDCLRVFDVNLRQSSIDPSILHGSLAAATLVKLNEEEALRMLRLLHPEMTRGMVNPENLPLAQIAQRLLHDFSRLRMVCITLGGAGSLLVTRLAQHRHYGTPGKVMDTIGAGDAFTGALVHYYLEGAPLPILNKAGNRWGAWVASQPGAIPPLDAATLAANAREIAGATQ